MNNQLNKVKQAIEPLRQQIINHKVYAVIEDIDDLRTFMQHHVVAVWDFMSLLKTLQNNLTCTTVPWFPTGSADTRYLINEIVIGEESDVDESGNRLSHFELYLNAMQQSGADTGQINTFTDTLRRTADFDQAFTAANFPESARRFVEFTFEVINSQKPYLQAAVFTFGREDLIPGMFLSIVSDLNAKFPESMSTFKYYLDRHIEVDGDHHSHLALQMTESLCGDDAQKWREVEETTIESLQKRIGLWDGVYDEIMARRSVIGGAVSSLADAVH
ncbi:DUF3050 domain-containing protein [Fibrella sp. HMF5335]|uniref:DUF3050 domain-containing protein n=1 Tax=Fibrella rubiginis TaxID=2817060 RepID=A0A939K3B6_9BACT|nr:DUF3050 domain-containing protein [Fibrella rubiginis]MBO0937194.1 DUF3050 domain-containing protein [Fibrella rubiginis]